MIAPPNAALASRTRRRPLAVIAVMIAAGVIAGALAAALLGHAPPLPASRLIGWRLADGFLGTPRFDPTTAQTATEIPISVDWLTCAPQNDSWLAPPLVSYSGSSVTITMHTTDAFAAITTCGGGNPGGNGTIGIMLDVGIPVEVQLSEPLGGRAVFDGGGSPPQARSYP